jgi:transcription elongation factor Elf1
MISVSTMHRAELYGNLHRDDNEKHSIHQQIDKQTPTLSNLFDWSIHNCLCKRSKSGLVLFSNDNQIKNIILLVCEQCFNYKVENDTQHVQLEKWYFNIYKDSKSFHFKSKFSQNEDGSLGFYTVGSNTNDLFNIKERELDNWEKDAIQRIVQKKSDNTRV